MLVIGLTGHAGSGKNAVADILVRDHGFTKMSFAAPVKRLLRTLDPIVGYDAYQDCPCGEEGCEPEVDEVTLGDLYRDGYDDETIKESPWAAEVRRLWQRFGTEVIRAEDPNFWVDRAQNDLLESGSDRVVFTDVRFPNEAEMIYNLGAPFFTSGDGELYFSAFQASVWQISRPDGKFDDDHSSESHVGLLEEEIQIFNYDTLEDLVEPVAMALEHVLGDVIPGQGMLDLGPDLDVFEAGEVYDQH